MNYLQCEISVIGSPVAIVTRPVTDEEGKPRLQTLCVTQGGHFYELLGTDARSGIKVVPRIDIKLPNRRADVPAAGDDHPEGVACADYDAFSDSIYIMYDATLFRIERDNHVTRMADQLYVPGVAGGAARVFHGFVGPEKLCSTHRGELIVLNLLRVHRVQLPASWRAGNEDEESAPAAADAAATVTTWRPPTDAHGLRCIAYHREIDSFLYSGGEAIYRLPLGAANPEPTLLAGVDGTSAAPVDGVGDAVRFRQVDDLTVDADGCVYVIDNDRDASIAWVRRLALDGAVTTLATLEDAADFDGAAPAILPNGYLALCGYHHGIIRCLDLGLQPPRIPAPPSNRPPPRSLSGDLASLLSRQPDGSADVTVVVGGRSFPAHRVILASRCDYFRQRLQGGFEDGASAVLTLPDVDPDAFALLLRFMYTGSTSGTSGTSGSGPIGPGGFSDKGHGGSGIPAELARSVAELADRLLLPELCREAQEVVLAGVGPESVVGAMLWAEGRGSGFNWLLGQLKAWYLGHCGEVLHAAPGAVKRLMREGPDLMIELLREGYARTSKMARQG